MTVRVEGVDHSPFEGVKVYAFDGTTYKGYSGTSGKDGQVTFTLPQGNYRFRGDLNGTQFWSSTENACTLPGCASAAITLPGGNTSRSAVTINYTYDGLSRLTAADYSSGDYYYYAYDSVGNRLTETTAKGETAYTYDPANRLTSVNGQAVQWDDNGNMLADGQAVYTYNTANKLVGVTKGASNIVYAYSGLGDRLRQIADGVTTDYTLDINAGLTQVLQDNTNKYVYGNQRISQIAETQTGYFLPDALGSMRQMTDSSADLTLAKSYDPYGNVVSSSGAGETVYGYTGEMQSGGLVHLRARDYASQLGRFTSRDTWTGNEEKPFSFNSWLYVYANPIILKDPFGKEPIDIMRDLLIYNVYLVNKAKIGEITDLEGLALLSESAASKTPSCSGCFVEHMGGILTGHIGSSAIGEILIQGKKRIENISKGCQQLDDLLERIKYDTHYDESIQLGQTGYDRIFQDPYKLKHPEAGGGNQAHHFWFYVQVGFESGNLIGDLGVISHETILSNDEIGKSNEDVALGKEGVNLGIKLMSNEISPLKVGNYIRHTLKPGSAASLKWWANKKSFENDLGDFWRLSNE